MKKINTAILGFGLSGKILNGQLIAALEDFNVTKVLTSRTEEVASLFPGAICISDVKEAIDDSNIDLIINCAPNEFHFSYSLAALEAGKHVVVEKPFVNNMEDGEKLILAAQKANRFLSVFHNRRWDSDFLTVKKMIEAGELGEIKQFESYFDRFRPTLTEGQWREKAGPGAGVLFDLGPHLIDQALNLFGRPESLIADVESQKGHGVDDYFHLVLKYKDMRVILHACTFSGVSPRFKILGSEGNYIKYGMDPQEASLRAAVSPLEENFGLEKEEIYGDLYRFKDKEALVD
ncbi:MAG: Gfo/Idh/MocA family oxidoreductase, partial [Bdellovibrionota bacterium]|nr:Gfo/Idh/MocA family oxidoreductase [Bdellovibrionota bacterium]